MVEEGILDRFDVGRVFALHNEPNRPLGEIGLRAGAFLAAVDDFTLTLTGRGGHAAAPHLCADPIPALLQIGQGLLAIPAREVDPLARAVVSLTVLAAGEAENVIPETARLGGTVRTLDEAVRRQVARSHRASRRRDRPGLRRRRRARLPHRLPGPRQRAGRDRLLRRGRRRGGRAGPGGGGAAAGDGRRRTSPTC